MVIESTSGMMEIHRSLFLKLEHKYADDRARTDRCNNKILSNTVDSPHL